MSTFAPRTEFGANEPYRLGPMRFGRLRDETYLVTNDVGEYVLLPRADLLALVERRLDPTSDVYRKLEARHVILRDSRSSGFELLALKTRGRRDRVAWFTGLHIFVATLRCDQTCQYCQVSRRLEGDAAFDMSVAHAEKALELVFRSPSPAIKIEFQGGEPLLHFDLVRHVVLRAEELNRRHGRALQFVVASNLSRVTDEVLAFCKEHEVYFSTSLDGPEDLHNAQRASRSGDSHALTVAGIDRIRRALGDHAVAALMTTTSSSLDRVDEIVDEYVARGFRSIFLRSLSPFGFATRGLAHRYDVQRWLDFYRRGLQRVLEWNQRGYAIREELTRILAQKILSPMGTTYVDLQSPAGIGIGALVYNYDGAVYASDESRMLAEMGDTAFRLGHVDETSYEEIMTSSALLEPLETSIPESSPMCSDCPFLPYCGADPVFHRATQGDPVGHKALSAFCERQMGVLTYLLELLEQDSAAREVILGWIECS